MVSFIINIIIVIDVILFLISILLFSKSMKKIKNYKKTTGEIIDIKKRDSLDPENVDRVIISPIIKYFLNNKEYKFEGKYCSPNSKIGDKIEILYDKDNPKKVCVKKGLFIAPIITGGIAIIFLIGLAIYFLIIK